MICEGRECRPWHRFKGKRKTLVEHGFFFTPLGGSQGWNSGHQTHDNCWAILLDFMFNFCGISTLFPQYWYQVLFTLAIFENIFVFLMVVILSGLRWNLGVVLIWFLLQSRNWGVSPTMYLLATCTSLENCFFNSLAHVLIIFSFCWKQIFKFMFQCLTFWVHIKLYQIPSKFQKHSSQN